MGDYTVVSGKADDAPRVPGRNTVRCPTTFRNSGRHRPTGRPVLHQDVRRKPGLSAIGGSPTVFVERQDTQAHRGHHRLEARPHVQLPTQVRRVVPHRMRAQPHLRRNVRHVPAHCQVVQHFQLSRRQRPRRTRGNGGLLCRTHPESRIRQPGARHQRRRGGIDRLVYALYGRTDDEIGGRR